MNRNTATVLWLEYVWFWEMRERGWCETKATAQMSSNLLLLSFHLRPQNLELIIDSLRLLHTNHAFTELQMVLSILKPASPVSWLVPSLSFLLASHMLCAVFCLGLIWQIREHYNGRLLASQICLQSATMLAGFLQICGYLNKDKIRCKRINQGTEEGDGTSPSVHYTTSIYVRKVVSGQFLLKCRTTVCSGSVLK